MPKRHILGWQILFLYSTLVHYSTNFSDSCLSDWWKKCLILYLPNNEWGWSCFQMLKSYLCWVFFFWIPITSFAYFRISSKIVSASMNRWELFNFFKDFIYHERGRDIGRGRSRLHAGSLMWDSILGLEDHTLSRRQRLNPWATQASRILFF